MSIGDVILLIMAIILPPLPVAIKSGACSGAFFLNLFLFLLAYLPGVIHAWYIILKHPEGQHQAHAQSGGQRDVERNPVTGTFPGAVYQPIAVGGGGGGGGNGNMDGVYGDQRQIAPGPQHQQHQQSGKVKGGYGAVDATTQPPPYQ